MSTTGKGVVIAPAGSQQWLRLARRARLLSWLTLGWLGIEAAAGVAAAIIAGSVALLSFGLDSGIEALASIIVIWRFTGSRLAGPLSERRAPDAGNGGGTWPTAGNRQAVASGGARREGQRWRTATTL